MPVKFPIHIVTILLQFLIGLELSATESGTLQLHDGYFSEKIATQLTYPTSVALDQDGNLYIAEAGYSYGDDTQAARILVREESGRITTFISSGLEGPVNDLLWYQGRLYVSHRGKISYASDEKKLVDVVTNLPSQGDHHNNQLAAGGDGRIYVGQGTFTNSGVVGPDNEDMGWLKEHPDLHDVPASDIILRGQIYESFNPLADDSERVRTSAFHRFGVTADPGALVRGQTKANGVIYSFKSDGSDLRVFASGFRNPYGLVFGKNGRLFATENGMDERGNRPVANDLEDLYEVKEGGWYGWPDFGSGIPITDPRFKPKDAAQPEFLLKNHPPAVKPLVTFTKHSSITKLDVSTSTTFGKPGDLFIAFFGHMTPMTGSAPEEHGGHRVVRVDPNSNEVEDFIVFKRHEGHGKAENEAESEGGGRFIDIVFSPDGSAMYVVDFGSMKVTAEGAQPEKETGVVWRIQSIRRK